MLDRCLCDARGEADAFNVHNHKALCIMPIPVRANGRRIKLLFSEISSSECVTTFSFISHNAISDDINIDKVDAVVLLYGTTTGARVKL